MRDWRRPGPALTLREAACGPSVRMPAGVHVVSLSCDLARTAEQLGPAADSGPWLNRVALIQFAACCIQDTDPDESLVSPVRADLPGLPPLLTQAAAPEALFSSAGQPAARAPTLACRSRFPWPPTASILRLV